MSQAASRASATFEIGTDLAGEELAVGPDRPVAREEEERAAAHRRHVEPGAARRRRERETEVGQALLGGAVGHGPGSYGAPCARLASYLDCLGMKERLRGNLDMLVLDVLEREPMHGYGVVRALRDRSGGVFELPEGTVYPSLHRLEAAALLQSDWQDVGLGGKAVLYRDHLAASAAAELLSGPSGAASRERLVPCWRARHERLGAGRAVPRRAAARAPRLAARRSAGAERGRGASPRGRSRRRRRRLARADAGPSGGRWFGSPAKTAALPARADPSPPWALVREAVVALYPLAPSSWWRSGSAACSQTRSEEPSGGRSSRETHRRHVTAERCAQYLSFEPQAQSCEEAAIAHHYGEVVGYRLVAGVMGLVVLAGWAVWRRRGHRRLRRGTLGRSFTLTVGAALASAAAAALLFLGSAGVVTGHYGRDWQPAEQRPRVSGPRSGVLRGAVARAETAAARGFVARLRAKPALSPLTRRL